MSSFRTTSGLIFALSQGLPDMLAIVKARIVLLTGERTLAKVLLRGTMHFFMSS